MYTHIQQTHGRLVPALCSSYCWILLLKTLTSMAGYGNSWPPVCVCVPPKASGGILIEKASVRASDYRAARAEHSPSRQNC